MKHRYQSVTQAPARFRNDPNYPGGPQSTNGATLTKTQHRATVDYDTYVLRYAATQRGNTLLAVVGAVGAVAAAVYLDGATLVLTAALGIGAIAAGAVGLLTAWTAHDEYRQMAVGVTETYTRPTPPPPATVRPFVASSNGSGKTTNTGRLNFTPQVWRNLFDNALGNGGTVTRDGAQASGVGRRWYHGEGWGELQDELTRLGFLDNRNRITPAALAWYDAQVPLPLSSLPVRSPIERTNGERTGANGDNLEWGESND